jgi:hypothetical protein
MRAADSSENELGRWDTFALQLPLPLTTANEAAAYLRALLPDLIPHWQAWQASRNTGSGSSRTTARQSARTAA